MHSDLIKLSNIAKQECRLILGMMSGTSLDGLDLALCEIKGHGRNTQLKLVRFTTIAYNADYLRIVKPLFANPKANLSDICHANAWIAREHARLVNMALSDWGLSHSDIDLIASHGQTIFHAPAHSLSTHLDDAEFKPCNSTLQLGDGDHIARLTQCITLSDFRQKHVAAGGEGAPMVKYGDYLLFTDPHEYRVLLNLGGIANLSIIPNNAKFSSVTSTDTGPANTLLDAVVQQQRQQPNEATFDEGGRIAARGEVSKPLLDMLLKHPFLALNAPKTTGQESFNMEWLQSVLDDYDGATLELPELLATLCEFSAICIAQVIRKLVPVDQQFSVYASGGGTHNQHLMSCIQKQLPDANMASMDKLGLDGDAKEAALFALLANECLCGDSTSFENHSGIPNISSGKISFPN